MRLLAALRSLLLALSLDLASRRDGFVLGLALALVLVILLVRAFGFFAVGLGRALLFGVGVPAILDIVVCGGRLPVVLDIALSSGLVRGLPCFGRGLFLGNLLLGFF